MNTNFEVIGLTRLGIEPKATSPEADVFCSVITSIGRGPNARKYLNF